MVQSDGRIDTCLRKALPQARGVSVYTASANSKLWNYADIEVKYDGTVSVARITVAGVSVLVCPTGTKLAGLPKDWLSSDFAVADSALDDAELLDPVCAVLSLNQEDMGKIPPRMRKLNPIVTGGEGNIVLELKDDQTIKLRRE